MPFQKIVLCFCYSSLLWCHLKKRRIIQSFESRLTFFNNPVLCILLYPIFTGIYLNLYCEIVIRYISWYMHFSSLPVVSLHENEQRWRTSAVVLTEREVFIHKVCCMTGVRNSLCVAHSRCISNGWLWFSLLFCRNIHHKLVTSFI